ncbi:MAG: alpha/beta fold hydrolase [Phycisphaerae bacterium]
MKHRDDIKAAPGRALGVWGLLAALTLQVTGCARLTDWQLARYRDDQLAASYRYALGEEYIDAGGVRICYQELGAGDNVLILPGLGTSADFWRLNISVLAERFHVLAMDLPGFGKSGKPDASYELSWMCEKIISFLDAKGIERTHVIGGSLGGHLALMMTLDHPDRVGKLVMTGSCGAWKTPGPLLDMIFKWFWNDATVTDHIRRNWKHIYTRLFQTHNPMTQEILRYQMAIRADHDRFKQEGRASSRALKSIFYSSCRDRLAEVTKPVLLIFGAHDFVHPPRDGEFFHRHLPDSRLLIVADAAHEVMVDQPDIFNREVMRFLGRSEDVSVGDSEKTPINLEADADTAGRTSMD